MYVCVCMYIYMYIYIYIYVRARGRREVFSNRIREKPGCAPERSGRKTEREREREREREKGGIPGVTRVRLVKSRRTLVLWRVGRNVATERRL